MTLAERIERSAVLKHELVEFALQPRFDRERRHLLRARLGDRLDVGEAELVSVIDDFVLQSSRRGASTVSAGPGEAGRRLH